MTDVTPFVTPEVTPEEIAAATAARTAASQSTGPSPVPPSAPTGPIGSSSITSPGGVIANSTDLLTRVLTPSLGTLEGKLAVYEVAGIQILLAGFGILTTTGILHPSAELSAEIVGVGQAIAGWISTQFLKSRTALKVAAASSTTS